MASKSKFDVNIIHEVKLRPILWDARPEDYKETERKTTQWLEVADKMGSTMGSCLLIDLSD